MCVYSDKIQTVSDNNIYLLLKELYLSSSDVVTRMKVKLILITKIRKLIMYWKGHSDHILVKSYSGSDVHCKEFHQIIAVLYWLVKLCAKYTY